MMPGSVRAVFGSTRADFSQLNDVSLIEGIFYEMTRDLIISDIFLSLLRAK